uniref:Methyltransferase type 11 domain-containing protein n=1 Tax=Aegilops tauschii subsp. strangulata TaxID=200361 RepID=A0A453CE17_AEGTS
MLCRRWIEGDALDLPFTDHYFDAVTVGYGLRNVVDKPKAMQEILRVLKPGWVYGSSFGPVQHEFS